jgi:hypothetical protein
VVTTRTRLSSEPPEAFRRALATPSYVLWKRKAPVGPRLTLDEGPSPGAVLDCDEASGLRLSAPQGLAAVWPVEPMEGSEGGWAPEPEATDEQPATQKLELEPGRWEISLQYDSPLPVEIEAPGFRAALPANLDFRGPTPYFAAGVIEIERAGEFPFTVTLASPPWLAGVLDAPREAHLRAIAAAPMRPVRHVPLRRACGRYVDWYRTPR